MSILNISFRKEIHDLVHSMRPISLDEMDAIKLLNRNDTKYTIHERQLPEILKKLSPHYKALVVDNHRLILYETLYYDTDSLDLYLAHHNGKRTRDKIRFRKYVDTGGVFFEIKHKTNKGKTEKSRVTVDEIDQSIQNKAEKLLGKKTILDSNTLHPQLSILFTRFTLANNDLTERVTIDINLSCTDEKITKQFPGLAIIEIKQDRFNKFSPIIHVLQELRIFPGGISKYCLSMASLNQTIKHNRFKPRLRRINKMLYGHSQLV